MTEQAQESKLFDGTLFLSNNIDYFQNGDDFFVYHNLYGYILKMSEDLVDFLEFFNEKPQSADEMQTQFGQVFDHDTLNEFLSIFRTLACLLPDDTYEAKKTHEMYPTQARWITVDQTNPANIVIYAFDTQSQKDLYKISLDEWESRLWSKIKGDKTVGEIAIQMSEEDNVLSADEEIRIAATLAQWSHCSVQAIKLSAEPCANFKGRRFGVPPYLISTMPYPKVTADVRTQVDEQGNVIKKYEEPLRVKPSHLEVIAIDEDILNNDKKCARLSYLLEKPHAVLGNRSYGKAVFDVFSNYVPFSGDVCRVLDVASENPGLARDFVRAFKEQYPNIKLEYTMFVPAHGSKDQMAKTMDDAARKLDDLGDLEPEINLVTGDIEKIETIFKNQQFDVIFCDEYMANLESVAVRKMSLDGDEDEDAEDEEKSEDLKPAHAADNKLTFIGEGDAIQLIFKYKLNLCDAPEDFILNSGSLRLIGHLSKLMHSRSQMFFIEYGEDVKYPVQTIEDGQITYSQHFGVLKQAAQSLGFQAQSSYWMEELELQRDLSMFATTRSQFKAMRQLLADHDVALERRPYTEAEFKSLLEKSGRSNVVEVNFEHAEDRISGLVPHAYKMLRVFKDLEF